VKYLQAWVAIMGGSRFVSKVGVVDGFAGPGVYADGEPGSPVLVLEALLDHDHFSRWAGTEFVFLFNEQDSERYAVVGERRRQPAVEVEPLAWEREGAAPREQGLQ
jgi:three-Cys-motif partner protein